jgi:hypothetical protein
MPISQRVVQVCLFLVAAIAMLGGTLQMFLGQPDTLPQLDNVHRFMVYLLALGVLLAGIGRLVSISQVGLPAPAAVWLGYLIPELLLPFVIAVAHAATNRHASRGAAPA